MFCNSRVSSLRCSKTRLVSSPVWLAKMALRGTFGRRPDVLEMPGKRKKKPIVDFHDLSTIRKFSHYFLTQMLMKPANALIIETTFLNNTLRLPRSVWSVFWPRNKRIFVLVICCCQILKIFGLD